VVRLVAVEAQAHLVPLRLVLSPPVPPVAADGLMMRQALLNITLAAVEARRAGSDSPVTVEVRPSASTLEIVVTYVGARPNAALLETWAMTVARSVTAGHVATLTLDEDHIASDVRIVTRWPIGLDPDAMSATPDAVRTAAS
jgi:hypothetical protein